MQPTTSSPAHLSARVTNLLSALEAIVEIAEPSKRRDDAVLELIRAIQEDADALADALNFDRELQAS